MSRSQQVDVIVHAAYYNKLIESHPCPTSPQWMLFWCVHTVHVRFRRTHSFSLVSIRYHSYVLILTCHVQVRFDAHAFVLTRMCSFLCLRTCFPSFMFVFRHSISGSSFSWSATYTHHYRHTLVTFLRHAPLCHILARLCHSQRNTNPSTDLQLILGFAHAQVPFVRDNKVCFAPVCLQSSLTNISGTHGYGCRCRCGCRSNIRMPAMGYGFLYGCGYCHWYPGIYPCSSLLVAYRNLSTILCCLYHTSVSLKPS